MATARFPLTVLATAVAILMLAGLFVAAGGGPPITIGVRRATPYEGYWCWKAPVLPGPHRLENGRLPGPREEPCSQDVVSIYAKPGATHDGPIHELGLSGAVARWVLAPVQRDPGVDPSIPNQRVEIDGTIYHDPAW